LYKGIPIIGIVGGVGSGKSHVARLFGQLGCAVIHSDEQVTRAYALPHIVASLRQWWGDEVFRADGTLDRRRIAAKVFSSAEDRARLEQLVHPAVAKLRIEEMEQAAAAPHPPLAFVWDSPLLIETGLAGQCDAVVFVDAPFEVRLERVRQIRGWDEAELKQRENSQTPLDNKRALSHYVVANAAREADSVPALPDPARPTEGKPPEAAVEGDDGTEVPQRDLLTPVRSILSRVLATAGIDGTDRVSGLYSHNRGGEAVNESHRGG